MPLLMAPIALFAINEQRRRFPPSAFRAYRCIRYEEGDDVKSPVAGLYHDRGHLSPIATDKPKADVMHCASHRLKPLSSL